MRGFSTFQIDAEVLGIQQKGTTMSSYKGEYPFADGRQGKIGVKEDHVLSGAGELMTLLEGQETIVKQEVVERLAKISYAPKVHAVRTMIMSIAQKYGYGLAI